MIVTGNDTRYVIEPRQLDYGLYMIQFNASMLDTVKDRFVLETESSISGFFVIKKCDLNAKIEGGTGKAVGQNGKSPSRAIVLIADQLFSKQVTVLIAVHCFHTEMFFFYFNITVEFCHNE